MTQFEILKSLVNQFGEQFDHDALDQLQVKIENIVDGCINRIEKDAIIVTAWERCLLDDLRKIKEIFKPEKKQIKKLMNNKT